MKKIGSYLLAIILVITTAMPAFAEGLDFTGIRAWENNTRSIDPGAPQTKINEFRFYKTKEEADNAKNDPNSGIEPINVQRIKSNGKIRQPELVEVEKKLFKGWFYDDKGIEKRVEFEKELFINGDSTFYAYPKYDDISVVFFSVRNTVVETEKADTAGHISKKSEPNIIEEDKVVKGWSIEEEFDTLEEAIAAGKLFSFKEETSPTVVEGSVILHAILEPAIKITYDTLGGSNVKGEMIKEGDPVNVPTEPIREGYKFKNWYVKEKVEVNGVEEEKIITLNTTTNSAGEIIFDYSFTKSTVIFAEWEAEEVGYSIIFMKEKLPIPGDPSHQGYEYVGTYDNRDGSISGKPKTVGKSGDIIKVYEEYPGSTTIGESQILKSDYLHPEEYENYLSVPKDSLKGLHLNIDKSNEVNNVSSDLIPKIKGDGSTVKIIYFDRDPVYFKILDKTKNEIATGKEGAPNYREELNNYKYGASSLWHPGNGNWKYIQDNFTENPPQGNLSGGKLLYLVDTNKMFTVAPPMIERDGANTYMKEDGDRWVFTLEQRNTYGNDHFLIIPLHTEGMDSIDNSKKGLNWLDTTATVTDIEARLLPLSQPSLVDFNGVSTGFTLGDEDYLNTEGYTNIMENPYYGTMLRNNDYKQAHEKLIDVYNNIVKPNPLIKKEIVENGSSNNNYYTFPIFYKRNRHKLEFETGDTSIIGKTITEIPYNAYLVGGADYDANPKEDEILNYMGEFEKAEFDTDGEVSNKDTVTKNSKDQVFMGWYEDPGFAIPFEPEKVRMPDRNLVAYAKWAPIYHTIIVHQHPYGTPGVNDEENINKISIEHNKKLDESNPKLEYLIPHGKRTKDFKGWETYGDNSNLIPSEDGMGSPFKYDFDRQVDQKIHLYPKWEDSRARVLYAFNYDNFDSQGERPIYEEDYIDMMENHLNIETNHMEDDKYYLSKYEYAMDTPLRLRSPFGYEEKDGVNFVKEPEAKIGTNSEGKKFIGWKIYLRNYETGNWTVADDKTYYYNSEFEITKNNISYDKAATDGKALGAIVFVAQWSDIEKKTQITLHANNGGDPEAIRNETDIIINSDYRIPSLTELKEDGFSKEGYIFTGWTINRDGSGKKFDDSELIYIDEYFEEQANHLYAQWKKIPEIIAETPEQVERDENYNIVIESKLPENAKPLDGTIYTLTDKDGNDILDGSGNKITAIPDKEGNLKFVIQDDYNNPTTVLSDAQTVKVKVNQPGVEETLSGESAPLDLIGPVITAGDIVEKVGIEIKETKITTNEEAEITVTPNLPNSLVLGDANAEKTEWIISGKGSFVTETNHKVVAVDKFGNKTETEFKVSITDKDVVDAPSIDPLSKGDKTAKITPPTNGDILEIVFPGDKNVNLEKQDDGSWKDPVTGEVYVPGDDGKIDVKVPDGGVLDVGDIVTAQGKDSTGKLADSAVVMDSVKPSILKTPAPQFDGITVGDTEFKIKPVNKTTENIIADRIVVSIRDDKSTEVEKIILNKKTETVWTDGTKDYTLDSEGKLTVDIPETTASKLTKDYSFAATAEDTFHGHEISDPTSIDVNAKQSKDDFTAEQGKTTPEGNPTIKGTDGVPGSDINVYDPETGDLIAGPVKVKEDGTYEIEIPKDKVPTDKIVDVKQKEDGKPESKPKKVTIDDKAPAKPEIDQPNVGDTVAKIKVPADAEKMIVTLPNGKRIELNKTPEGKWTDGTNEYTSDSEGKIEVELPIILKNNDEIKAVALDEFDNRSEEDSKIVGDKDSFKADKPEQKPRNESGDVVIGSKVPGDSNPADGTEYILTDDTGNPILDPNTNEAIKANPDDKGNLIFNVPDGVLKDKDKVKVQVKEPGKNPTLSDVSEPLDLVGPEITAGDINETVNLELADKDSLKVILSDENLDGIEITNTNLPLGVTIERIADDEGKPVYQLKGKPRDVIKAEDNFTITYTAVDKFGNTSEKTVKVIISEQEKTEKPLIDTIDEGDKIIKITPPAESDTITVTWPDGKTTELSKGSDGKWKDKDNKEISVKDGKLEVPVPEGTELKNLDIVKAKAEDKANNKLPSDNAEKAVGGKSIPPTAKQGETKENGNPTITGTGIPGSDINVYDKDGNKIAGPVKVDEDGIYEVEIPKDSVPEDGKVDITQTEKDKPESDPVEVTITEDIIPVSDPENPPVKPEGHIVVSFDETEKGKLPDGTTKIFYIPSNRVVNLVMVDPVGIKDGEIEYKFKEWDHALRAQFKKDTTITALYDMKWVNILPIPELETGSIITNIGVEPTEEDYKDIITADGNPLPDGVELDIVQPDVSTPGDKEAKVGIKFPDGSKKTVTVPVKVLKDIYPSEDGTRPADAGEDYVKVTLDPTDKGYYDNGPKTFYVRPGVEVEIPANDAKGLVINRQEYIFTGWDTDLKNTFDEDTVIKAQYKKGDYYGIGSGDVPTPSPDTPKPDTPKPDEPKPSDPGCEPLDIHKLYIIGFPDGEFKPENNITRAEVATIFARLLSDQVYFAEVDTKYADVKTDHWASGAIAYLTDKGIIHGRPDGKFYPQDKMTRAEYATVISNMKNMKSKDVSEFTDIKGHWAEENINGIAEYGIIIGYDDKTFKPEKAITRAEAVTMTNRAFNRVGDRPFIEKNLIERGRFPDVLKAHWAYTDIYEASLTHQYRRNDDNTEKWYNIIELGRELGVNRRYIKN